MRSRPIRITVEGEKKVALVPLGRAGSLEAAIYLEDYETLMELGLSGNWFAIPPANYVSVSAKRGPGRKVLVARVLLDAGEGEVVKFLDGNPLNMRRDNLAVVPSKLGSRRDREFISSFQTT